MLGKEEADNLIWWSSITPHTYPVIVYLAIPTCKYRLSIKSGMEQNTLGHSCQMFQQIQWLQVGWTESEIISLINREGKATVLLT